MNIEETKEAIRVMQAYVDGKEVEHRYNGKWVRIYVPRWDWDNTGYRIKPTATIRPWTADEVPLGSIMRNSAGTRWLIVDTSADSKRHDWCCYHEHSTDGGKTWLPCGVVEEAK